MEHDEQVALFEWAGYAKKVYPELEYMFAIPNGGKRNIGTAVKLKAEGVKSGVLDICLPVVSNEYAGLYIEMKYAYGKLSDNQKKYVKFLQAEGYAVAVCYDWNNAADVITRYMQNEFIDKVEV